MTASVSHEYHVVVNDEEQYSIWRADQQIPLGWREVGVSGDKDACLAHIESVWTDITPLSVRKRRQNESAADR